MSTSYHKKLYHVNNDSQVTVMVVKKIAYYEVKIVFTDKISERVGPFPNFIDAKIIAIQYVQSYLNTTDYKLETSALSSEVLTFLREQYPEYATVQSPSGEVGIIIAITNNGSLRVQGPKDIYTLPFGTYGAFEVIT